MATSIPEHPTECGEKIGNGVSPVISFHQFRILKKYDINLKRLHNLYQSDTGRQIMEVVVMERTSIETMSTCGIKEVHQAILATRHIWDGKLVPSLKLKTFGTI